MSAMNVLILGMGAYAFGKEKRATSALKHMHRIRPYFLISQWEDGSVSRLLQKNGFEFGKASFGYLGQAKPIWTLDNVLRLPWLFWKVINAYLRKKCQAVLVLNISSFVNALPVIFVLKYFKKARLIFYLGDIPSRSRFHQLLAPLINRSAEKIIANSEAVKRGLVTIGIDEGKIRVIYNGVDLEKFTDTLPFGFREKYGWSSNMVLIGYVGQFTENKGIWDFVEAAESVLQYEGNCRFLIIGRSTFGYQCEKDVARHLRMRSLQSHICLLGWIDEIERAYADLDILVVPSRHEDPAPNVSIEAMARGIPVVATQVGGNPEIVLDEQTGFLVERNQPKEIAARILRLMKEPELKQRMGIAGKVRVQKIFEVRRNASLIEEILLNGKA